MQDHRPSSHGPLAGLKVLEIGGLGPAPFAAMILADFGAEIVSVRRRDALSFDPAAAMSRGKTFIGLDLTHSAAQEAIRMIAKDCDILLEGFRPGVMERFNLDPQTLSVINPRLIYGRLTGWGQSGPFARRAGHDINYLAISGALDVSGRDEPTAPPGLLGDLANGSYLMVMGLLMAVIERARTGLGQVVDAAIVDGAAYMLTAMLGERSLGLWNGKPETHLLRGSAPFYGVYKCADERWFSVGAIEPKFYSAFLQVLDLHDVDRSPDAQMDSAQWPRLRERVKAIFATRPQAEWTTMFEKAEACGAPVLSLDELPEHPHLSARGAVTRHEHILHAAPAPRLSMHKGLQQPRTSETPRSGRAALHEAGFSDEDLKRLQESGALWFP